MDEFYHWLKMKRLTDFMIGFLIIPTVILLFMGMSFLIHVCPELFLAIIIVLLCIVIGFINMTWKD